MVITMKEATSISYIESGTHAKQFDFSKYNSLLIVAGVLLIILSVLL